MLDRAFLICVKSPHRTRSMRVVRRMKSHYLLPSAVAESFASLTNPYESSFAQASPGPPENKPRVVRWRLAPTILLGVLGGIGLLLGVGFSGMSAYNLVLIFGNNDLREFVLTEKPSALITLVFGPVVCLCWGCSWLYSSRCFWNSRWRVATFMFIFGAAALGGMMNLPLPR